MVSFTFLGGMVKKSSLNFTVMPVVNFTGMPVVLKPGDKFEAGCVCVTI